MALLTAYYILFYSYPFTLFLLLFTFNPSCLRPAVTRQYTKRVIIDVIILYLFCICNGGFVAV